MEENLIPILFENNDFLVINKPAGISVHKDKLEFGVLTYLKEQGFKELHLVHRLDKETTGLLILAKGHNNAGIFLNLFQNKSIQKYYIAICQGTPKKKQGSIIGDMVKSRRRQYKLTRSKQNPAHTHFFSYSIMPKKRLYILRPYTGKTHQLRVALNSIGVAIDGDQIYGGAPGKRLMLHCYQLEFTLKGHDFVFTILPNETDNDFYHEKVLENLNTYIHLKNLPWPQM